ncbi:MAG: tRNA uridine-5-carboxymethylaminomethyl(34) synthesis GTPase MnmE [Pseudomonadales bacterium]
MPSLPRAEIATQDADTIAAIATAPGQGGVGIVRISGSDARRVGETICGRRLRVRRADYVEFRDRDGEPVDVGIALLFAAPASFTGEDVVELQGHGGPMVLRLLLDAVLSIGARLARPGEFTERAFLNGKLDLAQAEAVADLIASSSRAAARGALRSLQGEFSAAVQHLDQVVLELRMFVEAAIDFPEEEVDFLSQGQVGERIGGLHREFAALIARSRQGILLRDGICIALVGEPNVGKSSLLNTLAGEDRAIVTEIPGTTRDLIRADLSLEGLPVQVVDTAGLRDSQDPVEQEGVRRARRQISEADLIVLVVDDRTAPTPAACALLADVRAAQDPLERRPVLRVRNKIDLSGNAPGVVSRDEAGDTLELRLSAKTGAGVSTLVGCIIESVGFAADASTYTARRRHLLALQQGLEALNRAGALVAAQLPGELVAEELRSVHQALGSIVGTVSADDLLGEIFASFCIGK